MPVIAPMQPPMQFQHQTLETGGLHQQHSNQMQKSYQVQQSLKHLREKAKEHEIELKKQMNAANQSTTTTTTGNNSTTSNQSNSKVSSSNNGITNSASNSTNSSSSGLLISLSFLFETFF